MYEHMMIRRRPLIVMVVIGVMAVIAALAALPGPVQAQDGAGDSTAELSLSVSVAEPGETITVRGSGFRAETDASFIYTSTITVGGVPIAGVESVDPASGYLHAARTIESGLYIAEHIDIDPAGTAADGAFTAELVLPHDLSAGDHYLEVTSCWGGPDEAYPEDGVAPCGTVGLGGGVKDRVAMALITILEPVDSGRASADEVVGVPGPAGREGPPGPQGPQGPIGLQEPQGAVGLQGARGPQGPQGLDGRDGAPGAIGARGPVGVAGDRGPAGSPGVDGRDGAPGPQGLPGPRGPAGSQSPASEALSIIALIVSIVALIGVVALYVLGRRSAGGRSEG